MEGKEKGRKKGRKESSFPSPEWCPSSLLGKERNPPESQCFQGIRRKEEREKEEERDGFRIRFLRGIQGKKDGGKLFFSPSETVFLSRKRKKSSVQWFQGKEKGKKEEKKDEVLRLEDGIFRGRLEEGKEEKKEEDLARWVSHKVFCLLFYSAFCNPVRINYNLPAGYGASAVT